MKSTFLPKFILSFAYVILACLILNASSHPSEDQEEQITINEFNSKLFWEKDQEGMVPLNLSFSGVTDSMLIVAVADMDGDKYTDLITINSERSAFRVFLYDSYLKTFEYGEKEFPTECIIANIQATKVAHDTGGLLVTCSKPKAIMKLYAYDDDIHDFTEITSFRTGIKSEGSFVTNPFIGDFNGDFFPDILYQNESDIVISFQSITSSDLNKNLCPTWHVGSNNQEPIVKKFDDLLIPNSENSLCLDPPKDRHLASPGAIGYVDIDGDWIADLIITTKDPSSKRFYVEIYVTVVSDSKNRKTSFFSFETKYWLVKRAPLPDEIDPLSLLFADFDREGMIDILGFSPTKKQIYIFMNGIPPRSTETGVLCYDKGKISIDQEVFPGLNGDLTLKPSDDVMFHKIYKIPYFKTLHGHTDVFPPRLRFGDINADGYPDLIATFELSGHNAFPAVLLNSPWSDPEKQNCNHGERIFIYDETKFNSELKKHNDCNYAFFFDIEENGVVDIILSIHDINQRKDIILPLMSNYDQDSFFLKTKVVRNVNAKNDVVQSGATIRASFTQLGDEKYLLVTTQKSQDSYACLGMSYAYFGIGRSTNYIEQFTVGTMVYNK